MIKNGTENSMHSQISRAGEPIEVNLKIYVNSQNQPVTIQNY